MSTNDLNGNFLYAFEEFVDMGLLLWPKTKMLQETKEQLKEEIHSLSSAEMRNVLVQQLLNAFVQAFAMNALQSRIDAAGVAVVNALKANKVKDKKQLNAARTAAMVKEAKSLDASSFDPRPFFERVAADDRRVVRDIQHPLIVGSRMADKFAALGQTEGKSEKKRKKHAKNAEAIWRYFKVMVMNADMCDVTRKLPPSVLAAARSVEERNKGKGMTLESSVDAAKSIRKNMTKKDRKSVKKIVKGKGEKEVMTMLRSTVHTSQQREREARKQQMFERRAKRDAVLARRKAEEEEQMTARAAVDSVAAAAALLAEEEAEKAAAR